MKKYISKNILINTIIYLIIFIIVLFILKTFNLMFRQWVYIVSAIIFIVGLIVGTFQLIFKIKKKILEIGLSIMFLVVITLLMLYVYVVFMGAIYKPEHVVYKNGKKYIAYVDAVFISNVYVEYYDYKNILVVGNKMKIRETYEEGALDPIENEYRLKYKVIDTIYYNDNVHYENARKEVIAFLEKNINELEEISKELILSKDMQIKKHKKVTYGYYYENLHNKEYIQFDLDAQGFLGGQYWGIIYSPNDDYLDGANIEVYDEKQETGKGNDINIREKIKDKWYFYYDDYDGKVNIEIIDMK